MLDYVNTITTIISNVGFPIACVIAMFYMWDKERTSHRDEVAKLTEVIQNNTLVLTELKTIIGGVKNGSHE